MWPFKKNAFKKLKREDVVNSICELEKEEASLENLVEANSEKINEYMSKGKSEKSMEKRIFYAKKINYLKDEQKENMNRVLYLLYNLRLLNKLKNAIDENNFYINNSKIALHSLLSDQKNLALFLNKALNTKTNAEDVLTSADDTFAEIESLYTPNQNIYGVQSKDDDLLAIFETENEVEDSVEDNEIKAEKKSDVSEAE